MRLEVETGGVRSGLEYIKIGHGSKSAARSFTL